ncbi:MAG TPA: COR domain-containing protein [Pyrinomonadaceae bacterium]|nr:COR domain-containing protein [Pyrinomonadaceae bacterium]
MSKKHDDRGGQAAYESFAHALIEKIHRNRLPGLNLSFQHLTMLPESIGRLTHLKRLFLDNNQLTTLPESISLLTQLQYLSIRNNQLTSLPEFISRLAHLERLDLDYNQLTTLPESIGRLTVLRSFDLSYNQLTLLPESLRTMKSLISLHLRGNNALGLPEEVLAVDNPNAILEYYFRLRGGRRPLNEAKLILVGRGAVGKTSIVNRLVHGLFRDEKKTEGIKITEWPLRLNGNEDVRLNVWDFGGQEIMHATHQFFLTQRSLYLLVINGREGGEDADAEYWLKLIDSFGGGSPVIVVLNKVKEHPFDVNRRALQRKYPFIRDFIKTDCGDGTGLEQLRKTIEQETDRLEHLRAAFPASWFTIKDRLSRMKRHYLSFEDYRKECAKLGEKDEKAQEALAFHLHSLGIALNYKDDPRLQDTHVLNPHWVTNGIYKVLNSESLAEQKGEIRLNDLSNILDPKKYPAKMHRFLFDLMKKFELCFSFPDEDTHYLIPELLDKQEPPEAAEFRPKECLNFQYHYPVLTEGLLPRFIVRTHTLSEGLSRWRTGVILKFEDNLALVKADVQDKKVFISVSGPIAGRRRLLAVIRSDFERIHRDIRNLQPQEMVPVPGSATLVVPYKKLQVMEHRGVVKFMEVTGEDIVELDVQELLNGVDLEGMRRQKYMTDERRKTVRLFYSYSHKDEGLRNELETHLKLLQYQGLIETWHDREIEAGREWEQEIKDRLESAEIILLLVSADFIASYYCWEKEMKQAFERHRRGEARIIPIIVRDVSLRGAPFAGLQYLPKDGLAVTKWQDKDSAWRNVSEGVEKVIIELRNKLG